MDLQLWAFIIIFWMIETVFMEVLFYTFYSGVLKYVDLNLDFRI
jgi:hypothetical protein